MYCYNDKGLTQDFSKVFSYSETGAKKGEVNSLYLTGIMCRDGIGTKKNIQQVKNWLTFASKKGSTEADEALKALEAGFILRVVEQESTF